MSTIAERLAAGSYLARWRRSNAAKRRPASSGSPKRSATHHLPIALFRDLLDAFAQDVTTKRYADYAARPRLLPPLREPIGRLLLHLFA
jgi:phytoene/squalene synthetase